MAEKREARSAVHLPRDQLVFVLTPSVGPLLYGSVRAAMTASRPRSRPRGESVQTGQVDCSDLGDPALKGIGVSLGGHQELGEGPDMGGQLGHFGAGGGELGQ